MKKYAFVLIAVIVMSMLGGCGKKENTQVGMPKVESGDIGDTGGLTLPISNKPVDIHVFLFSEYPNRADSLAVKELSRRTGLNIKTTEVSSAIYEEKVKVTIASGELPDIMTALNSFAEIKDLGMQGAFIPINKYVDQLPNFKKVFVDNQQNSWILKSGAASDGNLYYWPRYESARDVNHGFMYRKDIFDKNGIKEWKNTEEFYLALKKLKEIYPDSCPYVSKTKEGIFRDWSTSWGLAAPGPYYDENTKTWKLSSTDPKYKEMLDFMKKLYNEKLLDSEFITDTQANWISKMTQKAKAFTTFDWISRMDSFYDLAKSETPEYDLRYAYPIGPTGNVIKTSNVGIGNGLLVANNKNSLISLKLLDYLTSPSGAELVTLGIEGQTYQKDSNGKIKYLGFPEGKLLKINDLEEKFGLFVSGLYTRMDKRSAYFDYTEREQEAQDKIIEENRFEPMDPVLSFNNEDQKIVGEISQRLNKAAEEFSTRYVLSNYGDANWQNWLNTAKDLGEDKLLMIYNREQKRFEN